MPLLAVRVLESHSTQYSWSLAEGGVGCCLATVLVCLTLKKALRDKNMGETMFSENLHLGNQNIVQLG